MSSDDPAPPSDEEVRRTLQRVDLALLKEFLNAESNLRAALADGEQLHTWSTSREIEPGLWQLPHCIYSRPVHDINRATMAILRATNYPVRAGGIGWYAKGVDSVETCSLAAVVDGLGWIFRGERYHEGHIAGSLDDGGLEVLVRRLRVAILAG